MPSFSTVQTPDEDLVDYAKGIVYEREKYVQGKPIKLSREERKLAIMTQRNPEYHYIHGKAYDLREFYQSHPGGRDILVMTKGLVDSTPLFESYHSMANRDSILKQLELYRVKDDEHDLGTGLYAFHEDGFYRTVTRRVRAYFDAKQDENKSDNASKSVMKHVKANRWWVLKVAIQMFMAFSLYAVAFFGTNVFPEHIDDRTSMICAALSGCFFIQWGFTVMHDGSHFAIAAKNHWINGLLTRVWCSFSLWYFRIWMLHHSILHHSFTGNALLDPDVRHAMPFVRKHPDTPRNAQSQLFLRIGEIVGTFGYAIATSLLYFAFPGMWLGQVLQYFAFTCAISGWQYLWGMIYPKNDAFKIKWYEIMLQLLQIYIQIQRGNIYVSLCFALSLNFFYAVCIVGDHDTLEASVTNHVDVDVIPPSPTAAAAVPTLSTLGSKESLLSEDQPDLEPDNYSSNSESVSVDDDVHEHIDHAWGKVDWGESQVRNSSNFSNHYWFDWFSHCFGSINYQIEHHLFPGISHIHLPYIAPIVKETCEEFNIPYTAYPGLVSVFFSFICTIRSLIEPTKLKSD